MRNRLPWAVLFVATGLSGGCTGLCHSPLDGIPVRRLPDEVLHACPAPLAVESPNEITIAKAEFTKSEKKKVVPIGSASDFGLAPPVECPAPAGCASCTVFYTGGALGSGEYPLRHDMRVTEAIALARGPIQASCSSPSRVTIIRRVSCGQQLAIRVDLKEALRDPRENIPIWPNDMILTAETGCEATCRVFAQVFHLGPKLATRAVTGCPVP